MSIRFTGKVFILIIFLFPAVASAFDEADTTVSKNWGKSYHAFKQAQIANPDAGTVTGPVEGFEGRAAEKTMDGYHESFSQEQARQGYTMDNIGIMVGGQ